MSTAAGPPTLLVVGEALVDLVRTADGQTYAHPGGSPANVAVGLARLRVPTALLTRLGRDEPAGVISRHLVDNQVELIAAVDDHATNVAEASVDALGQADYAFRIHWSLPAHPLDGSDLSQLRCVHTGSIAATLEPGAGAVRDLVEQLHRRATVSYDPNCRPSQMGSPDMVRGAIEAIVARSDVVKASDEDLQFLYPDEDPADAAQRWLRAGPSLVVLTSGAEGYRAWNAQGNLIGDAVHVSVVDTVGAGDAFMSALLAGLLRRDLLGAANADALRGLALDTLRAVLVEAATSAAVTCSRPGADPPTAAELADWMYRAAAG